MADLVKAKKLLEKLNNGSDVSLRDLQNTIGADGVAEFESLWQYELDRRKQFDVKPSEIKKYEELVREADFENNKADGIKQVGKRSRKNISGRNSKVRLRDASEVKYERALEYLGEIIGIDDGLRVWFDRDLDFGADTTTLGIDCVGVARTVTSRSAYKRSSGAAVQRSKAEIKKDVVESAIAKMESDAQLIEEIRKRIEVEQSALIKTKLAALNKKR